MKRETGTAANAFRARVFGQETDRLIAFVCECGDPGCHRTVALTHDQYDARRPQLLIHEDHAAPDAGLVERAS